MKKVFLVLAIAIATVSCKKEKMCPHISCWEVTHIKVSPDYNNPHVYWYGLKGTDGCNSRAARFSVGETEVPRVLNNGDTIMVAAPEPCPYEIGGTYCD